MLSFRSKVTQSVLSYYFTNPHASHYINELARILRLDPKNLDRKLKELESERLLQSSFEGKQRYFKMAQESLLLKHYRELFMSKYGMVHQLKEKLQNIKGIKNAYIFGSYAKNTFDQFSDIDLLVVCTEKFPGSKVGYVDLQKAILHLEKSFGREINYSVMTNEEFKQRESGDFLNNIFSNKFIKVI